MEPLVDIRALTNRWKRTFHYTAKHLSVTNLQVPIENDISQTILHKYHLRQPLLHAHIIPGRYIYRDMVIGITRAMMTQGLYGLLLAERTQT
jgi:hypothetical protein